MIMNKEVIKINGLSYGYNSKKELLNNISLSLPESTILTVLGKNGTGKSTFLNCFMGYISDYSGDICIAGKSQKYISRKDFASMVGFVPQLNQASFDYTVEEFVLMGCSPSLNYFSMPKSNMYDDMDSVLSMLHMDCLKHRNVNSLSGGERQLVYIARALTQKAKIIVLDEPTSALDFGNSLMIVELLCDLRDKGYTIILTCHNPDYPFMFKGNTLAIFPNGRYIYGESEKILTDKVLSELYDLPIKREYIESCKKYVCIADKMV